MVRTRIVGVALAALAVAGAVVLPSASASGDGEAAASRKGPLVIGHRGASGYRPEHTLASYELAARMGADYVEPALVSTKDGVLVARHENENSGTTDVASHPEFTGRKTTKTIDGARLNGWVTEDLTKRLSWELKRDIGIAPETKHPTYFQSIGKPLEPAVVRTLDRNGLNRPNAKVVVQSFEVSNLIALNRELRVPLVQLTSATGA